MSEEDALNSHSNTSTDSSQSLDSDTETSSQNSSMSEDTTEPSKSSNTPSESSYSELEEDPEMSQIPPHQQQQQQQRRQHQHHFIIAESHNSHKSLSGTTTDMTDNNNNNNNNNKDSESLSDSSYSKLVKEVHTDVIMPAHPTLLKTRQDSGSDNHKSTNKQRSLKATLDRGHLAGAPLRHAQSPTTTISSLDASPATGSFTIPKIRHSVQDDDADDDDDDNSQVPVVKHPRRKRKGQREHPTGNNTTTNMTHNSHSKIHNNNINNNTKVKLAEKLEAMRSEVYRKSIRELIAVTEHDDDNDDDHGETIQSTAAHTSQYLLHGFAVLLGAHLQVSEQLQIISIDGTSIDQEQSTVVSVDALHALLDHTPTLKQVLSSLKPILQHYLENEPDDVMDHLLGRAQKLLRLLCEITYRVFLRQEWNPRVETAYVTVLEMLEQATVEIVCLENDWPIREYHLSNILRQAWAATGHSEASKTLSVTKDRWLVRQVCYEVLVSIDQWCPNLKDLASVCDVATSVTTDDDTMALRLAPIPLSAALVLEKIKGDPLPRAPMIASILRRILPPHAMTDKIMLDSFSSDRSIIRNPLGLHGIPNRVAITSVPDVLNDPLAMGISGVGKTTVAAVVAQHADVRRFFKDGIVWIHMGKEELDYQRYIQCLRDMLSQLTFFDSVPLFAELVHTPGEASSKRRRREEGFMIFARDMIAELLYMRNVLIVLDDVYFYQDLQWFQFVPQVPHMRRRSRNKGETHSLSLIVTTKIRDLLPSEDTLEVDLLEESDAIKLLVSEAGQSSNHVLASSQEALRVVRELANHPLAVKSVGRWLSLKHVSAGVINSVEEIHRDVVTSIDKLLRSPDQEADMMYEIMEMSLSPALDGKPTNVIKFCFASFVQVFCSEQFLLEYTSSTAPPMIPWKTAELLFETLLDMEEERLFEEGSLFYSRRKEAMALIPAALSALGVFKLITTDNMDDDESRDHSSRGSLGEETYLQIMHGIQHEYGEYLSNENEEMKALTHDAECRWNRAFVEAYLSQYNDWDSEFPDATRDYALELLVSHMLRAEMWPDAAALLSNTRFVKGRILALGREHATRRHIKDCEILHKLITIKIDDTSISTNPTSAMMHAYEALGSLLTSGEAELNLDERRMLSIETGRAHYELGFSLAEKRCLNSAIAHWESSQELLLSSLGLVEFVAAILFNVGVVYAQLNEYEQALATLQQCLRIRGAIHGEEHILFAQTIQRIGDLFLDMSDYTEATASYDWAMDIMHIQPHLYRIEIGEILDNVGNIHFSKGEIPEALLCFKDALRSMKVELGDDHPELAVVYQHIGNCLSDQGDTDEAIRYFEQSIRLKKLDPDGGAERDADVLSIQGVLNNLTGRQGGGLQCYEESLKVLVSKVPYRKEKIATLLHLIGCVHLLDGEHMKALTSFVESVNTRREVLGFVHLDVANTLFNMAFLHHTRGRLDKALKCLEESLKIRQLRLPDSEKVALTQEKIGTLAKAIGKSKKAEISLEEAIRIRRILHGDEHVAVASDLQEMGDLMDDLGVYDEAMKNYVEALKIRRKLLGDHEDVATTLYSLGYTLHNQGKPDSALPCFEESLRIRKAQLGESAKEVGDTLNMMGFLQAQRGELDSALTFLLEALRIRKLDNSDVKISETLKNIGNVHREKLDHELAIECYEECLRIRRRELGDDHGKVADTLIAIGNVCSDMEHVDDAIRVYHEALQIRTLIYGMNDERVAVLLQYMGALEFRCGDLERARSYMEEFVRIRKVNSAQNDSDYVNGMLMIGNIHMIQGDDLAAKECWSAAYKVFQALDMARENPQFDRVIYSLLHSGRFRSPPQKRPPQPYPVTNTHGSFFGRIAAGLTDSWRDESLGTSNYYK